jgi:hypothetical protein
MPNLSEFTVISSKRIPPRPDTGSTLRRLPTWQLAFLGPDQSSIIIFPQGRELLHLVETIYRMVLAESMDASDVA